MAAALVCAPGSADAATRTAQWAEQAKDPAAVRSALRAHRTKLHADFERRLTLAGPRGRLRVMVTTARRTPALEAFVRDQTRWVRWYGDTPAFYASVTPAQLGRLVRSPSIRFVEADYKVAQFLSISARDVGIRGGDIAPATPPDGEATVSLAEPTATWNGTAPGFHEIFSNILLGTVGSRVCNAPSCDTFRLGVADRGRLSVTTTPGEWVDLEIIGPDGGSRYRFGDSEAPVVIEDAVPGTYTVRAWVNTIPGAGDGAYSATATLSEATPGAALWRLDRSAPGLGALASADPALTTDQATGKDVTVAVIDGGIDRTHPDFGGRIKRSVALGHIAGLPAEPGDTAPTSDVAGGHGTHVAGIVLGDGTMARRASGQSTNLRPPVGIPMGMAPQASLVAIKNGELIWAGASSFAMTWLAQNAQSLGVRVVNNSWGCLTGCAFDGRSATALQIKALYDKGVLVVFAAGNGGGDDSGTALSGNSQSPYALSVANYNATTHALSSDSSRGESSAPLPDPATWTPESEPVNGLRRPDVAAPGSNIWAARSLTGGAASLAPRVDTGDVPGAPANEGTSGYVSMSGTSMAAPHVAGAAAVLLSACPAATNLDLMRAVMASADADRVLATDASRVAQPYEVGYGGLDVPAALGWLRERTTAC